MTHAKFQALADKLGQRRREKLRKPQPAYRYHAVDSELEAPRLSRQLSLTFEEINPVLEVYQRFDSREREIEWSVYSGSGEFLLQFGCRLDRGHFEIHSLHPELFLPKEEMRGYLEELNRRLATLYPPLRLVREADGEPALQKRH